MKRFYILTAFPEILDSYLKESFFARAEKNKLISVKPVGLRGFTRDKHKKIDDRPFGGGPGMAIKVEPVWRAVQSIIRKAQAAELRAGKSRVGKSDAEPKRGSGKVKRRIILFSLRGKKLDSKSAKRLSKFDELILICGRYEGVDERVAKYIADEEISIGDYVLSGGELPAAVLMEAVSRYIPGFLGKQESLEDIKGSYPVYTRPENFEGWKVPSVLLSGDHKKIAAWRAKNGGRTGSS